MMREEIRDALFRFDWNALIQFMILVKLIEMRLKKVIDNLDNLTEARLFRNQTVCLVRQHGSHHDHDT
jgi:hypothetical protein